MDPFLSLGFDLGWLNLGCGAVVCTPDRGAAPLWSSAGAELVRYSDKDALAGRRQTDVGLAQLKSERSALYVRRINEILDVMRPSVVAFEDYTVYDAEGVADLIEAAKSMLGLFGVLRSERVYASVEELKRALSEDTTLVTLLKKLEDLLKGYGKATQSEVTAGAGRGAAANTLITQGIVNACVRSRGIPTYAFSPAQVAQRWRNGKKGARGKDATVVGVRAGVSGSQTAIDAVRSDKADQYHLYDGTGLAVMGAEKVLATLGPLLPRISGG